MSFNRDFGTPNSGSSSYFNPNAQYGGSGSAAGTPQLPSTPRPLRPRPLPLESPGIYDFMDPNLTPIDQELKAGGFGMFHPHGQFGSPSVRDGSPVVRKRDESPSVRETQGPASASAPLPKESAGTDVDMDTNTNRGEEDGRELEDGEYDYESYRPRRGPGGLLSFSSAELEGYTSAQLYDLNQALLNDSVPTRPLIDALTPMSALREEYENGNPNFVGQIEWLVEKGYKFVRRTRGDGDCFYRSLAFAYLHSLIHASDKDLAVARALSTLAQTPDLLDSAGIEKMVYEDFYEEVVGLVEWIVRPRGERGEVMGDEALLRAFQDPEVSNAVVIYLRFVTSAHIRMNPDQFEGFVEHPDTREPMDVESYCANFVQAMGKEADNVEIQALVGVLQLNVDVAYLNGGNAQNVDFIRFRNDVDMEGEALVLLYRPGHYDVLSKTG